MEDGFLFGLMAVGLGTLCAAMAYGIKTQAGMLKLQSEMLSVLTVLTKKIVQQGNVQPMPMPHWRNLPPDARLMMRESLIEILREMDAEMPARH